MPKRLSPDEATDLSRAVRAVCGQLAGDDQLRTFTDDRDQSRQRGFDLTLWDALYNRIGVGAIAAPEHLGGAGYGATALGIVAHELGRCLAPVPFLASTVLATGLILDCVDVQSPRSSAVPLTSLIQGERTAAAVLTEDGGAWLPGPRSVTAGSGDEPRLTGTARHVLNGADADDLVVAANRGTDTVICWVGGLSPGIHRDPEPVLDRTRPMATIRFDDAPAAILSDGPGLQNLIAARIGRAMAVLSAEQVGANERVLEEAVAHARGRHQFGRPIGSFQAVKHRCADMLVDLEWARSASQAALQAADDHRIGSAAELEWRAHMAKAVCSESLRAASHSNVQIHGGIGFTWDHLAHLYFKRARTDEVILGTPALHWDRLGQHVTTARHDNEIAQGTADVRTR